MTFEPTAVAGAFVIRPERRTDERGHFARTWCRDEFAAHGVVIDMVQASISHNRLAGTLRGLHFSHAPASEGKLVRCQRGRVFDVIVDLRRESPSYLKHAAAVLDEENAAALYVPPGVAHGFQTLADDSTVFYMMSEAYRAECADGVRYDDKSFAIRWPSAVTQIAERDRCFPDFDPGRHPQSAAFAPASA